MNMLRVIIIFTISILCLFMPVLATDYYVNTSGNNGLNGTSENTAWDTVTYAATQATAGDTIWVDGGVGGGNYGNENVLLPNNGTDANHIVFRGYNGTPVLDGIDAAGSKGIYGEYKEYIEFHNFEIKDYNYAIAAIFSNNISIYNSTLYSNVGYGTWFRNSSYMLVDNCTAYDNSMSGFTFLTCWYSTVNDSEAYGSQDYGIAFTSWAAASDGGFDHTVTNNYVHDNQWHGIAFRFGVDDGLIENNNLSNNQLNIQINEHTLPYTAPSGNIIRNNTITLYREHGIYLTGNATNNLICDNNITVMDATTEEPIHLLSVLGGNIVRDNYINGTLLTGNDAACNAKGYTTATFQNNTILTGTYSYVIDSGSTNNIIRDEPQNTTIRLFYDSVSAYMRYYDSSVFSVSGSVSGSIPVYHSGNGYSGTNLLVGTAEVHTTNIEHRNIKLRATYDYIKDVVVNENSIANDRYNFTVNSSVSENPCWMNVTVVNASNVYNISKDGVHYDTVTSGSDSVARYYYSIAGNEWSNHTFVFTWASIDNIGFIDPTLANGSTTPDNYVEVNASIISTNLTSMIWNWNGTNCTFLNDSCVLYLSFDNNSAIGENSTVVVDVSQSGNNGSFTNGSTGNWTTDGKWNGAMSFDGVDDYVDCGNNTSLNITNNLTVACWAKRTSSGRYDVVVTKDDGTNRCWSNYFGIDDKYVFSVFRSNVQYSARSNNAITDGLWHYYVGICDSSSVRLYVDGILQTTTDTGGSIDNDVVNINIGRRADGSFLMLGSIDEVCICNRAPSPEEINQSYMSNLYKFNSTQWYFYTNQTSLSDGEYNYQIFTNAVESDYRVVTVDALPTTPIISTPILTPSTLLYNSTGTLNVSWIVEHKNVGLNNTSVSVIWKPQHTDGFYNWSWRWVTNISPDGWRGDNRNLSADPLNFETNDTITNSSTWEYAGCDENCTRTTISQINTTHTYVNVSGTIQDMVHLNSHYINRKENRDSTKTTFSIYNNHDGVIKVFDPESYHGHEHIVGFYLDTAPFGALTPTSVVDIWIANYSFNPDGVIDVIDSPNKDFVTSFNSTDWLNNEYQPNGVSYNMIFFNTSELNVNLTVSPYYYIIFRSNTPPSKSFNFNVTNVATSTNKTFADLGVMWEGTGGGYTTYAYTPISFIDESHIDMQWYAKLYVADNNGVWGNSTMSITNIDVSTFPPLTSSICNFYYNGDYDYNMNGTYSGTFDVRVLMPSDPDGGPVTGNLTIHYKNQTLIDIVNNSITEECCSCVNVSFDSTAYYSATEEYTLRVVATDDESSTSTYWLPVNFTLNSTISFSNDAVSPVTVLQGHTSTVFIDVNDTVGTVDSVIVKIRNVNYSMSLSSGDTWTYAYSGSFVGKHYVTNFYATDDTSDTNSTTSSLYINVLDSSGSGGNGPAPTATPTPTQIPTATPTIEVPKVNITVPNIFKIITGEGLSMFKLNFGTDNPIYSKNMSYIGIKSCKIIDGDLLANCDVIDSQVRVDVQPSLEGVYNYHTGYVQLTDEDNTIHDIPVEVVVLDVMGWVGVPRTQIDGLPFVLFEKEPMTGDVIGVRLWWIFGLLGLGLLKFGRDKRKKAS